jgi:hypothetical protein
MEEFVATIPAKILAKNPTRQAHENLILALRESDTNAIAARKRSETFAAKRLEEPFLIRWDDGRDLEIIGWDILSKLTGRSYGTLLTGLSKGKGMLRATARVPGDKKVTYGDDRTDATIYRLGLWAKHHEEGPPAEWYHHVR